MDFVQDHLGASPFKLAVFLGSAWAGALDMINGDRRSVAVKDVPGLVGPTVEGHRGIIARIDDARGSILAVSGRSHLYEGRSPDEVCAPVRLALDLGCTTFVLTNAAGGINPHWGVGTVVAIQDQLDLTATPLPAGSAGGARRMVFDQELLDALLSKEPLLGGSGVYAGVLGPAYETPAEVRMLRSMGADLVGMSTVIEAKEAARAGARVLGLSLVSNLAAGLVPGRITHADVLEAGRRSADAAGCVLRSAVEVALDC